MRTNQVVWREGVVYGAWITDGLTDLVECMKAALSPFEGRRARLTFKAELADTQEENPELVALRDEVARLRDRIVKANLALQEAGE